MSQAAGSPPPPQNPPPRRNFELLPAELILGIIQCMNVDTFVNFALAYYPLLRCHGIAPPLSIATYLRIVERDSVHWRREATGLVPQNALPAELSFNVFRYSTPTDRLSYILSSCRLINWLIPEVSEEIRRQLWEATDK
jgi:hypothetical protein